MADNHIPSTSTILITSGMGIYIPQAFMEQYGDQVTGIHEHDRTTLLDGPDNPDYWECWNDVEQNAVIDAESDSPCFIVQDEDLWCIPEKDRAKYGNAILDLYEEKNLINPDDSEFANNVYQVSIVEPMWTVCADNAQDALDILADSGKLDGYLIPEAELSDYPDHVTLGNYCKAYDLTYLHIECIY